MATAKRARDYHAGKCMNDKQNPSLMIVLKIDTDGLIPAVLKRAGFPDVLVWMFEWFRPDDSRAANAEDFHR